MFFISLFFVQSVNAEIVKLDPAFNSIGYVVHSGAAGGSGTDHGLAIAINADGKYVVTGRSQSASGGPDMTIWRYNPDGSLDTTFSGDGFTSHNGAAGGNALDQGDSIKVDSLGRYIVAGSSANGLGDADMAIWRYNPDGSLDTTFNSVGFVTHNGAAGGAGDDQGLELIIDSLGRYVVAGSSTNASGNLDMTIWRYNPDGSLDTTFNTVGFVTHDNAAGGNLDDVGNSLVEDSAGNYVIVGTSRQSASNVDMAIWRYQSDGNIDTTLGSVGYVTFDDVVSGSDFADSIIIDSGRYVICGYSYFIDPTNSDMTIWRYNPDGSLDTTFNAGAGYVTHDGATGASDSDAGYSIQRDSFGRYVVSGRSYNPTTLDDMVVWRYNPDGSLDTTFNALGYITHSSAAGYNSHDNGMALVIDSLNNYVITGFSSSGPMNNVDMVIWRYINLYQIANLDAAFDAEVSTVGNVEVGTANGTYALRTVDLSYGAYPLAAVNANFIQDLDWDSVDGAVDFVAYISYLNQITVAQGYTELVSLFVPYRAGDNQVGLNVP